jgi:cell division protein DivIC
MSAVTFAFASAYWEDYRLDREKAAGEREQQDLLRMNAQLREEARLLETPEYIERLAREQLGLVKKDEIAVMLVEPPPEPAAPADPPAEPPARSWWRQWLRWLNVFGW